VVKTTTWPHSAQRQAPLARPRQRHRN